MALLGAAGSVTVLCHVQPDADTVGAALALGLILVRGGADVQVSFSAADTLPESLHGLPGRELLVAAGDVRRDADLVVTVDAPSINRLGELAELAQAPNVLVIDHHTSNTFYGIANFVDSQADSTTMLIAELSRRLGQGDRHRGGPLPVRGVEHRHRVVPMGLGSGLAARGAAGRYRGR